MEGNPYYQNTQTHDVPPEARSIKDLVKMAGLIALIFAILGIVGAIFTFGVTLLFTIINFLIWHFGKEINKLIDEGRYEDAKSKTLIWMILGIILGGFIPGIILLIAYLKFDELQRKAYNPQGQQQWSGQQVPPPPPPAQQPPQDIPTGNTPSTTEGMEEKLRKLKKLYDDGIIDEEEYKRKKEEILQNF